VKSRYTDKQLAFLRDGYKKKTIPKLTSAFNNYFKKQKTEKAIRSALRNYGFTCGRKPGFPKGTSIAYSKVQLAWLKKNRKLSKKERADKFNKKFKTDKHPEALATICQKYGWLTGRTGHFKKDHKPWNTGTKGLVKPNSGNFKKGGIPANLKPVGHERICKKDGYILIKVKEVNPWTGINNWYRHKHVVVWEKVNGPIPDGHCLLFLDSNKLNCKLENLTLITRAQNLYLNQHGYKDLPAELRASMIALSEVETKRFKLQRNV